MNIGKLWLGCLAVSIGVLLLHNAHISTGGTVGLALSASYGLHVSFPIIYLLINVPFFILSFMKLGLRFTLSTIVSIFSLSLFSALLNMLPAFYVPKWAGILLGSVAAGIGTSYLFLRQSSLGGTTILVLYFQKRFGWNPGRTMFVLDLLILLTSLYSIGWTGFALSVCSALIFALIVNSFKRKIAARNHFEQTPGSRDMLPS